MRFYPLQANTQLANQQAMRRDDLKSWAAHGYSIDTVPYDWLFGASREDFNPLQVARGLWGAAHFLKAMLDMDQPLLRGVFDKFTSTQRDKFARAYMGPGILPVVVIKNQSHTSHKVWSNGKQMPLFTFGTSLMANQWLRDWEYAGVMSRIGWSRRPGSLPHVSMEAAWWRVVTHEYAHYWQWFLAGTLDGRKVATHGKEFSRALLDIRARHPFSTFPSITVMPRVHYKPQGLGKRIFMVKYNDVTVERDPAVKKDSPPLPFGPDRAVTFGPQTMRGQVVNAQGGHLVRRRK